MAIAAREARGPAEIVLMRMPYLRPASQASTLVSDSSWALADDMPAGSRGVMSDRSRKRRPHGNAAPSLPYVQETGARH